MFFPNFQPPVEGFPTRGDIRQQFQMFSFMFDEGAGSILHDRSAAVNKYTDSILVPGTVENFWDNAGFGTFAGDNPVPYAVDALHPALEMLDFSNNIGYAGRTMLYSMEVYVPAAIAADCTFISRGIGGTELKALFYVAFSNDQGAIQIGLASPTLTSSLSRSNINRDTVYTISAVMRIRQLEESLWGIQLESYADGVEGVSRDVTRSVWIDEGGLTSDTGKLSGCFFGRCSNGGGTQYPIGSGLRVRNMRVASMPEYIEDDVTEQWVAEYHRFPNEVPRVANYLAAKYPGV